MRPTSIVCWKWRPPTGYRSTFGPETVNVLRRMVARHFHAPHRFICLTDDPAGLDPAVEVVPMWRDHVGLVSQHGPTRPSCYRRLRAFSADVESVFGRRFVSLDLDCVIVRDVTPLWDRPDPFVIWAGTHRGTPYNASMILMTAGARRQVWDRFDPQLSPPLARAAGCYGSDQAWVSYCLGPGEPTWSQLDGVYSFRNDLKRRPGVPLPADARIVFFHGHHDPWGRFPQTLRWVQEHYR